MTELRRVLGRRRTAFAAWIVFLAAPALLAATARAHETWVQPNVPVAVVGEPVYVDVYVGNHSHEHRSYRIAGKASFGSTALEVYQPGGDVVDYSNQLVDYGEPDDVPPKGKKGHLGTQFVPRQAGIYIVVSSYDRTVGPVRSAGTAKTFVAAVGEVGGSALPFTGWDRVLVPDSLELVPLDNPTTVRQGSSIRFQLLLEGKPVVGQKVSMIRRATGQYWDAVTDGRGVVTFYVPAADYYLVRTQVSVGGDGGGAHGGGTGHDDGAAHREDEAHGEGAAQGESAAPRATFGANLTFVAR